LAAKFLPYRNASRYSVNAQAALNEAIARVALFLATSQEEKNWEDVEADDDDEDSMLAHRGNNLFGFRVPAPPSSVPDAKTAVKAILAGPVIPSTSATGESGSRGSAQLSGHSSNSSWATRAR
jgi:hypothetical protein